MTTDSPTFKKYRRKQIAELRPYIHGDPIDCISVSEADKLDGSPKAGDMIARNPKNHNDQWLVAAKYFADNFEECDCTVNDNEDKVLAALEAVYIDPHRGTLTIPTQLAVINAISKVRGKQ